MTKAKSNALVPAREGERLPAPSALANADPREVFERYLKEESTASIAASYGVSRSMLNRWLLDIAEKDWKDTQIIKAIRRKEDAEEAMERATNGFELAKAEKLLKAAQWDLEKVFRRIYGDKIQVHHTGGLSLVEVLVSLDERAPPIEEAP